jgi:hypothetical protein
MDAIKASNATRKSHIHREMICRNIDKILAVMDDWNMDNFLQGYNNDTRVQKYQECQQTNAKKEKQRVRFADMASQLSMETISRHELSPQEIKSMWWSTEELQAFRYHANQVAAYIEIPSIHTGVSTMFDDTYAIATSLVSFCDEESMQDNFMDPPEQHVRWMVEWNKQGSTRRGLERYAVDSNGAMATAVSLHRTNVLNTYREFKDDALIAEVSQNMTRGNRMFARFVGFSDALIVERNNTEI